MEHGAIVHGHGEIGGIATARFQRDIGAAEAAVIVVTDFVGDLEIVALAGEDHVVVAVKAQLRALKDIRVWEYSQHYAIVFGGYVALSLWMTKYYINEYGFGIATAALIATPTTLPSTPSASTWAT